MATTRLTTKEGAVLAMPGETCEEIPAESLGWLWRTARSRSPTPRAKRPRRPGRRERVTDASGHARRREVSSSKVVFLCGRYNFLLAKPQSLSHKVMVLTERYDGLGDEWEGHSATGMRSAELVQGGAFFNTAAGNSHAALKDASSDPNGANRIATVGFAGNAIGQPILGFEGILTTEYEPLGEVGKLTRGEHSRAGQRQGGVGRHPPRVGG